MDLKFKLGDRVKTLVDKDENGHELFPTGTKGIITDIFNNGKYPYEVMTEDGNFWYYNDSMLELANPCPIELEVIIKNNKIIVYYLKDAD